MVEVGWDSYLMVFEWSLCVCEEGRVNLVNV